MCIGSYHRVPFQSRNLFSSVVTQSPTDKSFSSRDIFRNGREFLQLSGDKLHTIFFLFIYERVANAWNYMLCVGVEENHGFTITVNTVILTVYRDFASRP